MTAPLSEDELQAIIKRDEATGDGLAEPDYLCAQDRHSLLGELNRLRHVVARIQTGVPVMRIEGGPWWQFE